MIGPSVRSTHADRTNSPISWWKLSWLPKDWIPLTVIFMFETSLPKLTEYWPPSLGKTLPMVSRRSFPFWLAFMRPPGMISLPSYLRVWNWLISAFSFTGFFSGSPVIKSFPSYAYTQNELFVPLYTYLIIGCDLSTILKLGFHSMLSLFSWVMIHIFSPWNYLFPDGLDIVLTTLALQNYFCQIFHLHVWEWDYHLKG